MNIELKGFLKQFVTRDHIFRAKKLLFAAGMAGTLFTSSASASQLALAQSPLFVSAGAPANIFLLTDNSGSMDWSIMTSEHNNTMGLQSTHSGTAQSATNTGAGAPRITLAASASATNDRYHGMYVRITGGTGAGQALNICADGNVCDTGAYTGSSKRAEVLDDWIVVPNNTSTYQLFVEYGYLFPETANTFGSTHIWGRILPSEEAVRGMSPIPTNAHGVWLGRNKDYNKIYYDPGVNYRPWPGVDSAGNPFKDAKAAVTAPNYIAVTALRLNPYNAAAGTINITTNMTWTSPMVPNASNDGTTSLTHTASTSYYAPRYYTYTDSNSNGRPEASEPHQLYEIRTSGTCPTVNGVTKLCPAVFNNRPSTRSDCVSQNGDGTYNCTASEELKNFSNWFMYYRKRMLVAKGALANVVDPRGGEVRMGYGTLNNSASNFQIETMNTDNTIAPKRTLLDRLFATPASGGTALRTKLDQTGRYYECTNGSIFGSTASYTCPWLAAPQGTCQQSFTILTTDGFYNDTFSGIGNTDADGTDVYDGGAYADTVSNTLGDVAMHYYERDLRSTLSNNVPVIPGVDTATHQHMVTYGVALAVTGTLASDPPNTTSAFAWPNPTVNGANKIDDLRHAAYNGRGEFWSTTDPTGLATALQGSIDSILATTGSASAVAVNSRTLTSGTVLYQARFTSVEWSGDLRAISLDETTGNIGAEVWNSGTVLKTQASRVFMTYRKRDVSADCPGLGGGSDGGVAFTFSNLSTLQQCLLDNDPTTVAFDDDDLGDERVDYLRGDTSDEGSSAGQFRPRTGGFKLGDIVNSTPAFVGEPSVLPDTLEAVAHSTFRTTHAGRPEIIYVGANDGMLHGFDANNGEERIAFVPSQVYANLNKLTDPNYRNTHQYFVDGSPTVADAYGNFINGCSSTSCWRTILVGGLAGGGKSVFALDVTDPEGDNISNLEFDESNAANIVMWEFVDSTGFAPGADMGYVYGEVSIAKMQNGRWAAIFGNGYNSTNENAVLYIVDIIDGSLMKKIVLNPYGSATGNSNGLSAPMVFDANSDYVADYIYAGDLRGNLWKIDVSSNNTALWDSAHKSGATEYPLFVAVDSASVAHPITARPTVRAHPTSTATPSNTGYLVYVGSGRYVTSGDKTPVSSPIHTMYGIWDQNVNGAATPVVRANLLAQSITQTALAGSTVRIVSSNAIDWTTHRGWALNLRTDQADSLGEMAVSNPVLATAAPERLIFTTLVPLLTACTYGGTSWLMEISPVNGGNLGVSVFDVNNDGVVDSADTSSGSTISGINPGIGIMPEPVIVNKSGAQPLDLKLVSGSTGDVRSVKNYLTPPAAVGGAGVGRRSWRQIQ